MTTQTSAIVIPSPSPRRGPGRHRLVGLAGVLTVAAAVAVAGGLWQANRESGTEPATPPPVAVERPAVTRPAERAPTYYLVGSQAEADAQRAIVALLGTPPLPEVVTLATSADADAFFRAMDDVNGSRINQGLVAATVIDRRVTAADPLARELDALTAASAGPAPAPAALSDREMHARWLEEVDGRRQANGIAAARVGAPDGAAAPGATAPVSTCESIVGSFAC